MTVTTPGEEKFGIGAGDFGLQPPYFRLNSFAGGVRLGEDRVRVSQFFARTFFAPVLAWKNIPDDERAGGFQDVF